MGNVKLFLLNFKGFVLLHINNLLHYNWQFHCVAGHSLRTFVSGSLDFVRNICVVKQGNVCHKQYFPALKV